MKKSELTSMMDVTLVKNNNTVDEIELLAEAAKENGFSAVFTLPCYAEYMVEKLSGTGVHVGTTAGFPWGGEISSIKALEAARYISMGVDEIDMVINLGYLFSGMYNLVLNDIRQVRDVIPGDKTLKCIVESALLSDEQLETVTKIVMDSGADYIKTGTGFHGPAEVRHVEIMNKVAKGSIGIKAAGGIRTYSSMLEFINAGATRFGIGYASAMDILKQIQE